MEQLFEKFGLHLNLLIAQIINFGILFFVLYKFAYKPILNILDKRRERIEASLKEAKAIEVRTKQLEQEIEQRLSDAKKRVEILIGEARDIGEKARNEILVRTNQEVTAMIAKTKADIAGEKEKMMSDIQDYIVKTSLVVVEKIFREKLDEPTRVSFVTDSLQELTPAKK